MSSLSLFSNSASFSANQTGDDCLVAGRMAQVEPPTVTQPNIFAIVFSLVGTIRYHFVPNMKNAATPWKYTGGKVAYVT